MDWYELIIGAFVGAFIGFLTSYFFLIKETQKKIEYEIDSFNLITEKISEKISFAPSLKIRYGTETDPEDVKILTSSIIKIENTGYNAIEKKDISPDDPLRIFVKDDFKLYFAREIDRKGTANNFEINSHDEKYVDISFTHLNPKDGIKIQVFHSGNSSDAIDIFGTVIGGPKIKEKTDLIKNIGRVLLVTIVSCVIYILIIFLVSLLMIQNPIGAQSGLISLVVMFVIFVLVLVTCLIIIGVDRFFDYIMAKYSKKPGW